MDELDFLKEKEKTLETIEFVETLLHPKNSEKLDKLIEEIQKVGRDAGHPFVVGKSRSAREKFVKDLVKKLS